VRRLECVSIIRVAFQGECTLTAVDKIQQTRRITERTGLGRCQASRGRRYGRKRRNENKAGGCWRQRRKQICCNQESHNQNIFKALPREHRSNLTIKNYFKFRNDAIKSSISASFHLSSDILNTSGSQSRMPPSSSPRTM
jgi:hypothetical protein